MAVIARLREDDPVHYVPGLDFWLVTRHEDVKRLFADPAVTPDRRAWSRYQAPAAGTFGAWAAEHGLFALPPEEHARIRRLVSAAFTPRAIARQEACVQEVVERFAAPLRGRRGVVDLMAEFTDPIPNCVISRITGIPPEGDDEVRFRELAQLTIRGFFAFYDRALQERGGQAFSELVEWVRKLAAERRAAISSRCRSATSASRPTRSRSW
jgi:cytochrome P450